MAIEDIRVEGVIKDIHVDGDIENIVVENVNDTWYALVAFFTTCEVYSTVYDKYYTCEHFPALTCEDPIIIHETEQDSHDHNTYVGTF